MDTLPRTSGIYKWTCVPSGKIYIGSAVNLEQRWREHRKTLRNGTHSNKYLLHTWGKYGEAAFTFEVIELVLSSFLLEREQYWLDKLKSYRRDKGFNINTKAGSPMGRIVSEETRRKMSQSQRARDRATERPRGPWTDGRKLAYRAARKEAGLSQDHKEKMRAGHAAYIAQRRAQKELDRKDVIKPPRKRRDPASYRYNYNPIALAHARDLAVDVSSREYRLISPSGAPMVIKNLSKFARDNGLVCSCLRKVVRGERTHHKGWGCDQVQQGNRRV